MKEVNQEDVTKRVNTQEWFFYCARRQCNEAVVTFLVEDFRHYFKEQIDWLFSARLKKLGFTSLFDESCYVDMQGR
ncbi:hypothetical protein POPTR_008G014501v4 [Populus trichocarpa]|uniref:Glycoside hydrolase family 3 N-terminal domain-containing protein n=1 Tax=Populus trichocarpa TaxID=3694 RepID=A0A2K1Z9Y7_POPTR|nr:hypothetical protein POPTR_008G014501v4 [Populus trichocarpa]